MQQAEGDGGDWECKNAIELNLKYFFGTENDATKPNISNDSTRSLDWTVTWPVSSNWQSIILFRHSSMIDAGYS